MLEGNKIAKVLNIPKILGGTKISNLNLYKGMFVAVRVCGAAGAYILSGRDCVKSLRPPYTGMSPQSARR